MYPVLDKKQTAIHIRKIMEQRGLSAKDIQKYLQLSCVQSVYRWLDGVNLPSIDNLYALSELFQLPIDEIVRGNRETVMAPACNMDTMNSRFQAYLDYLPTTEAA